MPLVLHASAERWQSSPRTTCKRLVNTTQTTAAHHHIFVIDSPAAAAAAAAPTAAASSKIKCNGNLEQTQHGEIPRAQRNRFEREEVHERFARDCRSELSLYFWLDSRRKKRKYENSIVTPHTCRVIMPRSVVRATPSRNSFIRSSQTSQTSMSSQSKHIFIVCFCWILLGYMFILCISNHLDHSFVCLTNRPAEEEARTPTLPAASYESIHNFSASTRSTAKAIRSRFFLGASCMLLPFFAVVSSPRTQSSPITRTKHHRYNQEPIWQQSASSECHTSTRSFK